MDPSKEGLLSSNSRSSIERRRRDSSDTDVASDIDDIDATEFLSSDPLANPSKNEAQPAFLHHANGSISHSHRLGLFFAALRRPFRTRSRCCIITLAIIGLVWLFLGAGGAFVYKKYQEEPPYGQSPPWYPSPKGGIAASWADSYRKAAAMVAKMTLPEKVNVTTGTGWEMGLAVGTNGPAVHVGFPQLQLQDGPLGIRFADNVSAFPAGITVGATWNRHLMYARGKAHGAEAKAKGIHVLLGPCVGPLGRMPAGGRNWEGFGADPYLQGVAGAWTVRGIQSEGVMATIKHFVANEQEHFRQPWEWALPHAISSNIDDRTLHEMYAWPFADAIKAGVASVMCSYNMVNNSYACSNSKLLNGILKDEMGFQGFIMSDWLAQRSGVASALAGLDMTMPGDGLRWQDGKSLWGSELTKSILNGSVPVERLNDMVTRIVAAWYQLGQDDPDNFDNSGPNFSSWTDERMGITAPGSKTEQEEVVVNKYVNPQGNHSDIARQVAAEGIVLLKNDGVLPLSRTGSGKVAQRPGDKFKVGVFGEDAGPGDGPNSCKDRGCNQGTLGSGWGSGAVEFPYLVTPVEALRAGFDDSKVQFSAYLSNTAPKGKNASHLTDQDLCIVFANADSGEGFIGWGSVHGDRPDLHLQKGGDELIAKVAAGCGGDTIVVIHSVGPVIMEKWIGLKGVKAVLYANLPGQESGNALADVIFGDENPSGKLPYTIGKSLDDYGPGGQILYIPNGVVPQQDFNEGLYIDYRYFDKKGITPRFEFGFGLSYTTFEFTNLKVTPLKAKVVLPPARPNPATNPPKYDTAIPDEKEALWPDNIRRLDKYIYPYLDSINDIVSKPYPYPDGYDVVQPLSGAGGDEGGHPELWKTYVTVSVDVTNTGAKAGKTVAQLYLAYPKASSSKIDFPEKVLRGFDKLYLGPGETRTVEFSLTRRDLSYWDVRHQNWMIVLGGQYKIMVGDSSRNLPVSGVW